MNLYPLVVKNTEHNKLIDLDLLVRLCEGEDMLGLCQLMVRYADKDKLSKLNKNVILAKSPKTDVFEIESLLSSFL